MANSSLWPSAQRRNSRQAAAVTAYLAALPAADVTRTVTYWPARQPDLVSADRHSTYAVLSFAGATDQARENTYKAVKADFPGSAGDGITARVGGTTPTEVAIDSEVSANIARAEGISFPVLLILLVLIFGGVVAALAPLAVGGLAILGSFTVLRLLTLVTPVSVYSVNVTTIMGLGLGIDYGLFIVTRFREELRRQAPPAAGRDGSPRPPGKREVAAAVARTVATAGRTVLVSGVTVALAMSSLMLFPAVFLRSMGYGGVATVAVDVIAALTVLPALLTALATFVLLFLAFGSVVLPPPAASALRTAPSQNLAFSLSRANSGDIRHQRPAMMKAGHPGRDDESWPSGAG